MRRSLTLLIAALMVTSLLAPAAMAAPASVADATSDGLDADSDGLDADDAVAAEVAETAADCEDESDNDLIGCWAGVHHTDDLEYDQSDGLTEAELERLTYLKMARVEYIRERPFKEDVPVETMTREEFAEMQEDRESDAEYNRWNDQVWKGLFVVGEDEPSEEAINTVFSGAVAGFYSPAEDRVVIVTEGDEIRISPTTLLHELGHAMQDQYDDLSDRKYSGETQDADLAIDGIVEGEVVYMEEVYAEHCEDGTWGCTEEPSSSPADGPEPNLGILLTVLQPYSDGAPYVDEVIEEEGWDGVDRLMDEPPETTTEVIHREPFDPEPIEFEDTATDGWETYPEQGVEGHDTVGEASIFVMFWYQNREYGADTFDWQSTMLDTTHPYEDYNYVADPSDGWANDELYPYRNDEGDAERDGYVWVTEWQTEEDAAEFHDAYDAVLDAHDAERRDDGVQYVEDGPFRGAYGVERDGTTVTIVHALDPEEVFELRPDIEPDVSETPTPTPTDDDDTETPTPTPIDDDDTETPAGDDDTETPTEDDSPGFGAVAALVGIVAAVLLARRSR